MKRHVSVYMPDGSRAVRPARGSTERPYLGFGLGLRVPHFEHVVQNRPAVDWFEVLSENFMVEGGKPKYYLHKIREHYPLVMHGVSLSIGSTDDLNIKYLSRLKALAREIEPEWISDHLCWTTCNGINSHDLLPLPYNADVLDHVVDRVLRVQDYLGRQILLENVSSYVTYRASDMTEWEFLNAVARRADCHILLDINNIYVSARNHRFSPLSYLEGIDADRVYQFHLAGHTVAGDYLVDTHDHDVSSPVWDLYAAALKRFGQVSTMIERDDNIPPFDELFEELQQARVLTTETLATPERHACS